MLRALAIATLLLSTPSLAADDWAGADKALHFSASAGLALLGSGAASYLRVDEGRRLMIAGTVTLALGASKELIWDMALRRGNPSWLDMAWNAIGTAAGLVLNYAVSALLATVRSHEVRHESAR